jgi:putative addiction module killer protein
MGKDTEFGDSYPAGYNMILGIESLGRFDVWLSTLRDTRGRELIQKRLLQIQIQKKMAGDTRYIGDRVFEMRFFVGPGYRVYATKRHNHLLLLLAGGTKRTQRRDIAEAKRLAKEIEP